MTDWQTIADTVDSEKETSADWGEIAARQPGGDEEDSWGDVLKGALINAPSSAFGIAKDMYNAIAHPIDTAKAIGGVAFDVSQKLAQTQVDPTGEPVENPWTRQETPMLDATIDFAKERYGSVAGFKQTLKTDSVGVMADLASVMLPVGKALKVPAIVKGAALMDPLVATTTIAKKGTSLLIPKSAPSRVYASAVKLSTVIPLKQRKKIIDTALAEQLMPTYRGVVKLDEKINTFNSSITEIIEDSIATGQKIPVDKLFDGFDELRTDILKTSGQPILGSQTVDSVRSAIEEANELIGRGALNPMEAQKMKQRIYKELDKEYAKVSLHPISKEAQMLVARNLKESIEKIIPEIKQLNASEGELIELKKAIERVAPRITNRDFLSLGTTAKAAGGAAVAGGPGMVAGLTLGLLDSQPIMKAKLGLVLSKLKSKGIIVKPTPVAIRLGLFQAGRLEEEIGE